MNLNSKASEPQKSPFRKRGQTAFHDAPKVNSQTSPPLDKY